MRACTVTIHPALPGVRGEDVDGPGVPLLAAAGQLCPQPALQALPLALQGKRTEQEENTQQLKQQPPNTST